MAALNLEPGPDFVLRGHRDSVNALCFLSDNELASGSGDGIVKIWNLTSRRSTLEVKASETSSVLSLSHIQSEDLLISCARDGVVHVWDTAVASSSYPAPLPLSTFYCGVGHFCNAATDRSQRDPNTLVTPASDESQIILWDLRVGCGASRPEEGAGEKGTRGVLCKAAGCIDADKGKGMLSSLHYNSHAVRQPREGCSLYAPSTVVDKDSDDDDDDEEAGKHGEGGGAGEDEKAPTGGRSACVDDVLGVCCSPLLLAGFESGGVTSFDLRTRKVLSELAAHHEPVMAMDSFSPVAPSIVIDNSAAGGSPLMSRPRSTAVVTGGAGSQLCLHRDFKVSDQDLSTSKNKTPVVGPLRKPGTGCVRFRPDGKVIVSGHWDHSVRIFSGKALKPLAIMRQHSESVYAVDFAPGQSGVFASGSKDCTIALWSTFADTVM